MLLCGSMRGRKGSSDTGHQGPPPTTDGSVALLVSCVSFSPPVRWRVPLRIPEFVMHVLSLRVKHLHDNKNTGKYQLVERAACLRQFCPRVFFLASKQLIIRRERNDAEAVQQHLALNTSSLHQMEKSACNKQKYFLTQVQAFYKLRASFQL